MSHFAVAVFTKPNDKTVHDLLAPYDEGLAVEPYLYKTKEELEAEIDKYIKENPEETWHKGLDWSELVSEWCGKEVDEDGNALTTYNPNSKWDWYSIGGRFPGKLKANKGIHGEGSAFSANPRIDGEFDSARVGDIDFSIDTETYDKAIRFWEVVVEHSPLKDGEDKKSFFTLYNENYYLEYYKDKETYAKIVATPKTYAVVTPDGVWHEKGQMGWFGASTETGEESLDWDLHYKERFIDTAEDDWYMTIVDCHI